MGTISPALSALIGVQVLGSHNVVQVESVALLGWMHTRTAVTYPYGNAPASSLAIPLARWGRKGAIDF